MFPINEFKGAHLDSIFIYIAVLGVLLFIGTFVRLKLQVLKNLHIPASLVAGVIGLLLGPHFLKLIPPEMTSFWSALSGRLIVLVFAPMMMAKAMPKLKTLADLAGPSILWSYAATSAQYAFPILLSVFLLTPIWDVHPIFATIVEQGWAGGHGTSGGMAAIFEELNWIDGASLSVTSATFGLLFGIIFGTVLINIGVKKGWTSVLQQHTDSVELTTPDESPAGSKLTVNSNIIDSMAFHIALVAIAILIGWVLNYGLKQLINFSVAWFVTSLFGGLIVNWVMSKTKYYQYMDKKTFDRIQGVSLEFLVAGAVAAINVPVIVEYALPLAIQQTMIAAIMVFFVVFIGRRVFKESWFENSIVLFGTFCGVAATGLLLLRTCDPEMKSGAAEVFAARAPFTSPFLGGGLLTSITPGLIMQFGALQVGLGYLVAFVVVMIAFRVFGWWKKAELNI